MTTYFAGLAADDTAKHKGMSTRRWLTGPPGSFFMVLVALATVATVMAAAAPGGWFPGWLLSLALWNALVLAWAARFLLQLASRDQQNSWRRRPVAWLLTPAIGVGLLATADLQVPMRVGAVLAQSDAAEFAASGVDRPDRIGPYPVKTLWRLHNGAMAFEVPETQGWGSQAGLAYSPNEPLTTESLDGDLVEFDHFFGPWYQYTRWY